MSRPKRTGSVFLRKDGRWEGRAVIALPDRQRRRISVYGRTQAEATRRLDAAMRLADAGHPVNAAATTLGGYLDYWLQAVVATTRQPATYEIDETNIRLYLKPGLGKRQMADISVRELQNFWSNQLAAGVSVRTVHKQRAVLSAALTHAMREELIERNAARLVELPAYRPKIVTPWTVAEVGKFLVAARDDPLYIAFFLGAHYGLRRGEICGLRWTDIDVATSCIRIRSQLQRRDGKLLLTQLKTPASNRDLPLTPPIRSLLEDHRRRSGTGEPSPYVIHTATGKPIEPRNLLRSFKRIAFANGLRPIKLQELRHTTVTLLKEADVPVRDGQAILGHASATTTLQIYQHSDLPAKTKALDQLTRYIEPTYRRQKLPSPAPLWSFIRSINSGSGEWTRTTDPRLMRWLDDLEDEFPLSQQLVARVCDQQQWLGHVAVKNCRQRDAGEAA